MRKIRKGKDISVRWPILTNGKPLSLDGRDLTLFIKSQYNVAKQLDFTTEDNVVVFTFPGTEQQMLGNYSLTLWENYGKAGQTAVDCCEAFTLVACTCEEDSGDEGLDTGTVDLESSSIEVGINGSVGGSLPAGGTAGQVLTKVSDADGAADWQDVPVEAGPQGPQGPQGEPGPLIPGGTAGQVLTKTSDGAAWQDAPAGGALPFKIVEVTFPDVSNQKWLTEEEYAALRDAAMLVIKNSILNYNYGNENFPPETPIIMTRTYRPQLGNSGYDIVFTNYSPITGESGDGRITCASAGLSKEVITIYERSFMGQIAPASIAASISDEPIANAE